MNDVFAQALAHLPHGQEFRFIDRLTELTPGTAGAAQYFVHADATFLRGHFPNHPLMPGVLLVEAVAQLAGVVAQSDPARAPLARLKLTAIRSAKISGTAQPGELITVQASILGRMGNLIQAEGSAAVNGTVVLRCEITLSGAD